MSATVGHLKLNLSVSVVQGLIIVAFPISELYFLIAKFLTGGPLKETAKVKTLLNDLKLNNLYWKWLKMLFFVTDSTERARECRGKSELFLVPV